MKEYLECGKILGPHGVRGLIRVESWCDSPKVLTTQKRIFLKEDGGYKECSIESAAVHGPHVLLMLSGIADRETVQAMKNTRLYLHRGDIPLRRGAYFLADIIGLPCIDADSGAEYGTVKDITDSPASRLYIIAVGEKEVLIPDVPEFIKEIDPARGVFIRPIPGFFD